MNPNRPSDDLASDPGAELLAARSGGDGLARTLWAAVAAGAQAGALFGLIDGVVALVRGGSGQPSGWVNVAGCLAAAVLWYTLHALVLALLAGFILHPLLRQRDLGGRTLRLFSLLLGLGLFLEIYWWTRPFVFYGDSAVAPRRLAVAAVQAVVAFGLGLVLARLLSRLPSKLRLGITLLVPLLLVAGGFFRLTDGAAGRDRGAINDRNRDLPNVLLFVVDALRADVTEPYADQRDVHAIPDVKTPHLAKLAASGVTFERAYVQAPFTWSSFGSILTGKYPRRHGLISMEVGRRMVPNVTLPWHLKSARRKDGVQLEDGDYAGGTFMTGTLSHGSGLMRGFDSYSEALVGHSRVDRDSQWSRFRSELLLSIVRNKLDQRVDSSLVVTTARQWLREHEGRRFVAMVHLYSTHTPYDPPGQFREMYVDPDYTGPIQSFYADHRIAIERGDYVVNDADVAQIKALYHAGVSQADDMIGQVLDELEELGMLENTVVVVTADHGESFAEHELRGQRLWEHNWMVQTNLQVPLLIAWPGQLPAGKRVAQIVDTVDLFPTLCDLLGLEPPPEIDEYEVLDGKSALPLIRGESDSIREFSYAENPIFLSVHDGDWKLIVNRNAYARPGDWGKALDGNIFRTRLFDLGADPGEQENLLPAADAEARAQANRLRDALLAWDASMPIPRSQVIETSRDQEHREMMNALGYTGEGIVAPEGAASGSSDAGVEPGTGAGGGGGSAVQEPR